jgi:hypothetical protein
MRARVLAVVLLVALLGAPACGGGGAGDDGYRLDVHGRARVTTKSGERTVEDDKVSVQIGETVRMLSGTAELGLPGDRSILLRARDDNTSIVHVASTPEVLDGDVVAIANGDALRFTVGDVDVRITNGAARVQRGLGVTVAMYRGSSEVRSAGRRLQGDLPALRQVSVAATGLLPRRPVPLVYDEKHPDPWDLRFLGDAIELGGFLDSESKGFTSQLGPRATVDASLLQDVLPPLADEGWITSKLAPGGKSAGETLVGAAIVVESGGALDERWDDVFAFRDAGARWGLVALDQRVQRDALKDRLRDALGRSPLLFAAGPRRPGSNGATPSTTSPSTPPSTNGGGGGTTTTPPPTTSPVPTVPPTTVPPPTIPEITIPPLLPGDNSQPSDPSDPGSASPSEPGSVVEDLVDLVDGLTSPPTTAPPLP